ncbi:aspartyl/glutamyl-tRNA(Asn/Gln) amidotransferase subunit B [Biomphalaria pfeifferi]|uniref:Glutamyl-tRNA(Gln) amidotransferase subunit B, mitochondrial n=1 Tax=Biomphalaria pfeifferi TaxID=112525 RepID=A0AAD8FF47_BIOPF|nr:aspartyl/glutamyl-tRNA(Asn/Gln) amidotransferase subunit B [Biomphalaria pfeifferi]
MSMPMVMVLRYQWHKLCILCRQLQNYENITNKRAQIIRSFSNLDLNSRRDQLPEWQGVIGLEIHAQIQSVSKLFSGAATNYNASTNTQVAYFDAALPGTLPVLNKKCVEAGIKTALALNCDINMMSLFDRKHYFYADMPAGYQITQYRKPLAINGHMPYVFLSTKTDYLERRSAKIFQIQLEQDSGKSLHDAKAGLSLIDLNRAGIGLMEIVTAPNFTCGDDAASFVRDLRDILVTIGACDGRMAEGSLRVDANISVNRLGEPMGTRTEVKNLNSLRNIRLAVDYEINRQIQLLESGGVVENETRSFDVEDGETLLMREKEKVLDYRFMPEPNLPPLIIHKDWSTATSDSNVVVLELVKSQMKELPEEKRKRLEEKYKMELKNAVILVRANLSELFEKLVDVHGCNPVTTSALLRYCYVTLLDNLKLGDTAHMASPLHEAALLEIAHIFGRGEISLHSAFVLMETLVAQPDRSCIDIIEEKGLWIVTDESVIKSIIEEVCTRNRHAVKAFKKGKKNQFEILRNKVVKKLEGKSSIELVNQLLNAKLKE